jgi:hypothetical protein
MRKTTKTSVAALAALLGSYACGDGADSGASGNTSGAPASVAGTTTAAGQSASAGGAGAASGAASGSSGSNAVGGNGAGPAGSGGATAGATTGGTGNAGTAGMPAAACAVDPMQIYDDVAFFASDDCRGRIPSDQGNKKALDYAQAAFVAAGLSPGGENGTYRQAFDFSCNSDWCENHRSGKTENVLAKIEGSDPALKSEVIVIGAHIDHLGFNDTEIYRGADDNAAGAAIVMQLARMFQRCGLKPKRTLLFVEWNAEEMGLLGSKYYVAHPTLPLDDTIAVYNFDMVGSGDGSGVLLFGGDDDENRWLTDLMMNAKEAAGLTHVIQLVPQKLASDHAPFVERGIPVCWGFSRPDPHPGYHSPQDDMSRIKLQSLRAVSELFWAALKPLAMGEEAPLLAIRPPPPSVATTPPLDTAAIGGVDSCGH